MDLERNFTGQAFGRWTVLDACEKTKKGEKKWLCRCACGTERYVLERSLVHGGSLSCGCLRKERTKKAGAYDLTGQTFGDFTVLGRSEKKTAGGGLWWRCRCVCGNEVEVLGTLLVTGRKSHCGCKSVKNYAYTDITGQRFGRLTALYPTKARDSKGSVIWHCRCACGNEVDAAYNSLAYANQVSCGCRKKEHDQALPGYLNHIDGTSMEMLASKKVPANNTTGTKGVYFIKGKYVAKIVFQKKAYYLGTYDEIGDAIAARQEAEETVFEGARRFYGEWRLFADADPKWAAENPASIRVGRDENDRLRLETAPDLQEKARTDAERAKRLA